MAGTFPAVRQGEPPCFPAPPHCPRPDATIMSCVIAHECAVGGLQAGAPNTQNGTDPYSSIPMRRVAVVLYARRPPFCRARQLHPPSSGPAAYMHMPSFNKLSRQSAAALEKESWKWKQACCYRAACVCVQVRALMRGVRRGAMVQLKGQGREEWRRASCAHASL